LDGRPVDPDGRKTYSEAFIHSEIYRARPDVQSVVHSHALPIVAFSAAGAPFKAIFHQAFFIGSEPAPVFDSRSVPGQTTLLVANSASGAVLAKALGQRAIVLMRGHGMAVTAPSIRGAVYEAIYAVENARVESEALRLGAPVFLNAEEVATMTRVPGLNADRPWEQWAAEARTKRGPGGAP
jgi:HCOMODA/2-hydroxy-3-carboxy-muconic semialdehyde decarboxylase